MKIGLNCIIYAGLHSVVVRGNEETDKIWFDMATALFKEPGIISNSSSEIAAERPGSLVKARSLTYFPTL